MAATLALVLATAGTSYAAIVVTSVDIKENTVKSRDVRDGTLRLVDIDDPPRRRCGGGPARRDLRVRRVRRATLAATSSLRNPDGADVWHADGRVSLIQNAGSTAWTPEGLGVVRNRELSVAST